MTAQQLNAIVEYFDALLEYRDKPTAGSHRRMIEARNRMYATVYPQPTGMADVPDDVLCGMEI